MMSDFFTPEIIVGIIGILFGILIPVWLDYKDKRKKKPIYSVRTESMLHKDATSDKNLKVKYDGEVYENIVVSYIVFWNDGKITIDNSDSNNTLNISLKNGNKFFLNKKWKSSEDRNTKFDVKEIKKIKKKFKELQIEFSNLEKNEGISLKLVHEGDSSNDLVVTGIFNGVRVKEQEYIDEKTISVDKGYLEKLTPLFGGITITSFSIVVFSSFFLKIPLANVIFLIIVIAIYMITYLKSDKTVKDNLPTTDKIFDDFREGFSRRN